MTTPDITTRERYLTGNAAAAELIAAHAVAPMQAREVLSCGTCPGGVELVESRTPGARDRVSIAWPEREVAALVELPDAQQSDLDQIPAECAIIVRQQSRTPDTADYGAAVAPRTWLGVDLTAPDAEQRNASRMWWRVGDDRWSVIARTIEDSGAAPLLVSVGGLIVTGYNVIGLDEALMGAHPGLGWALALDPATPAWLPHIADHWLPSGRGPALVVRHLMGYFE